MVKSEWQKKIVQCSTFKVRKEGGNGALSLIFCKPTLNFIENDLYVFGSRGKLGNFNPVGCYRQFIQQPVLCRDLVFEALSPVDSFPQ